jgi:ferredoxin
MKYRITIDEAACSAHGDCAAIAPEAFEVHEVARVVGTTADELMLEAAEACPALAITVSDAVTGDVVFP